jgi:hypothetical protein
VIAQLVNVALGLWLMAAPTVLDYGDPPATSDRIAGPIIASLATIAIWEATRPLGRVNALLGAWLVIAPLPLGYPLDALVNSIAVGVLVVAVAWKQRSARQRFDGGWSMLWRPPSRPATRANTPPPSTPGAREGVEHGTQQT